MLWFFLGIPMILPPPPSSLLHFVPYDIYNLINQKQFQCLFVLDFAMASYSVGRLVGGQSWFLQLSISFRVV